MQPAKTAGRAAERARKLADYDAWYDEQIRIGVEAADAGEVVTAEEFESGMDRHMAKLTAKYGRKIA